MSGKIERFVESMQTSQSLSAELMDKLLAAARPGAVYGEPIKIAERTIIPACEVSAGGGLGFGGGIGVGIQPTEADREGAERDEQGSGVGGGSGGGGASHGRPVAAIVVDETGIQIQPIPDVTKISLAFFATLGTILITLFKMRRDVLKAKQG